LFSRFGSLAKETAFMRLLLTGMSAMLICGCLSRGNSDLLRARIRDQQSQLAETERQMTFAQSELQRARREAESLRTELARGGMNAAGAEYTEALVRVRTLQIHSLLSGGVNKDEKPGDDAFVAQVVPVDEDGEIVKLPGNIELTLLDPALPESQRQIGHWKYSAEECRSHWTRGFTGAGYQFTMPLTEPPAHESLVLHAKLTASDGRSFDANQVVRVTPSNKLTLSSRRIETSTAPKPLDDINDPPPAPLADRNGVIPEWAEPKAAPPKNSGFAPPLRDSTNWTDETIPRLR
jgi:outer membrane murein-binding lipoprotein Lpp